MTTATEIYLMGYVGVGFHLISKFFPIGNHSKKWTTFKRRVFVKGTIMAILAYTILYFGLQEGFGGFFTMDVPLGRFAACMLGLGSSSLLQHWSAKLMADKEE
jgi:hypothetical protein